MKFQLERIALFSDAVFAIAITLMMIEIKAPHLPHGVSFGAAMAEILKLTPTFIGTILSFLLIGIFWKRHHQLMKYMTGYNGKVIIRNLALLLTIAFLPFSTSFVFENFMSESPLPMVIYNLNYILATLMNYRLFAYILNPANGMRVEVLDEDEQTLKKELLFPIFVYGLVIILTFVSIPLAPIAYATFSLEPLFVRRKKSVSLPSVQPVTVSEEKPEA